LFALGTQAIRERGEVGFGPVTKYFIEVIALERTGVEQEAADQRALAVVDRTGGRQSQELALSGRCRGGAQK
jgi:hypothetical protein